MNEFSFIPESIASTNPVNRSVELNDEVTPGRFARKFAAASAGAVLLVGGVGAGAWELAEAIVGDNSAQQVEYTPAILPTPSTNPSDLPK